VEFQEVDLGDAEGFGGGGVAGDDVQCEIVPGGGASDGGDAAANPVEHLLHALASCLTTSMVAHDAVRGIEIAELESALEGDIDLRGFLGLAADVPKGYTEIRAKFRAKAKPEDLGKIRELAKFSPVFQTVTNGAKVDVQVELK
jgi:uncharacterized OsmC-like protein